MWRFRDTRLANKTYTHHDVSPVIDQCLGIFATLVPGRQVQRCKAIIVQIVDILQMGFTMQYLDQNWRQITLVAYFTLGVCVC